MRGKTKTVLAACVYVLYIPLRHYIIFSGLFYHVDQIFPCLPSQEEEEKKKKKKIKRKKIQLDSSFSIKVLSKPIPFLSFFFFYN